MRTFSCLSICGFFHGISNERKLMEARRSERSEESSQFLYVSRGERSLWNVRMNVWRQAKLQLIFRLFLFEAFPTSSDH
jgi:hypothetical protein